MKKENGLRLLSKTGIAYQDIAGPIKLYDSADEMVKDFPDCKVSWSSISSRLVNDLGETFLAAPAWAEKSTFFGLSQKIVGKGYIKLNTLLTERTPSK